MRVEVLQAELAEVEADLVAVGLCEGDSLPAALAGAPGAANAVGAAEKLSFLFPEAPARVLVAGLGKREELDAERLRVAAALVAKEAGRRKTTSLAAILLSRPSSAARATFSAAALSPPSRIPRSTRPARCLTSRPTARASSAARSATSEPSRGSRT